ncbi:MAG: M23 family metallopeptidase [Clostridiales bacterium]|nr:M23 family metallopeptidase [Clostridiales bacterium]
MDNREIPSRPSYLNEYRRIGDLFGTKSYAKEKTPLDRLLYQLFVSLAILAFILLMNSIDLNVTKTITQGIKSTLNWKIDVGKIDSVIKSLSTAKIDEKGGSIEELDIGKSKSKTFIIPLEGEITSAFGERIHPVFNTIKQHNGIDINGNFGDDIKAASDGTVVEVGESEDLGKFLRIKNGIYDTLYAHCSKIIVKEGQKVKQSEKIAEIGDTGFTSGPHLHFEVWVEGSAVNPLELIN